MSLSMTERCDRLDAAIRDGRLIRNAWTVGENRVCLLAALSPECAVTERSTDCPAEVAPRWLAELTPWIDDNGSDRAWPAMVRRYAAVARRWHALTPEAWERVRVDWVCDDVLPEALSHVVFDEHGACQAVEAVRRALREGSDINAPIGVAAQVARAAHGARRLSAAWAAESAFAARARDTVWAMRATLAAPHPRLAVDHLTAALLGRIEAACSP